MVVVAHGRNQFCAGSVLGPWLTTCRELTTRQERGEKKRLSSQREMSEARDTSGLLATQTPGTKRSLSYSETEDHQFSTEGPSPKLYRSGLSTVRK